MVLLKLKRYFMYELDKRGPYESFLYTILISDSFILFYFIYLMIVFYG